MIKVLHVLSSLDSGGVENLLYNYYKNMDKSRFVFDFIVHGKEKGKLEKEFEKMNSQIFHITIKHESLIKNLEEMNTIISKGNYDVVHAHQGIMSVFPMYFAYKANTKKRIAHSHQAFKDDNFFWRNANKMLSIFLKKYTTIWAACGQDAGKYLWGEKGIYKSNFGVINNAISIEKFTYNSSIRNEKRKELGVENKFVIGNIGRFTYQKNHEFLIDIFNEVYKINKNSILLLIGNGELESKIKKRISEFKLSEAVLFLGIRNDVPELMQAMDIFLLPSRYEGLPVVLVEAQASGLMSIASEVITKEVKVTDFINYIDLNRPPQYWANIIAKYSEGYERKNTIDEITKGGYDIKEESRKLESLYE